MARRRHHKDERGKTLGLGPLTPEQIKAALMEQPAQVARDQGVIYSEPDEPVVVVVKKKRAKRVLSAEQKRAMQEGRKRAKAERERVEGERELGARDRGTILPPGGRRSSPHPTRATPPPKAKKVRSSALPDLSLIPYADVCRLQRPGIRAVVLARTYRITGRTWVQCVRMSRHELQAICSSLPAASEDARCIGLWLRVMPTSSLAFPNIEQPTVPVHLMTTRYRAARRYGVLLRA